MAAGDIGAGAELADQHDLVALRIVGQHGAGLAALEHFAADDAAHAALVQRVPEEIAADLEVALERDLVADELHRFVGQGRRRHGKLRTKKGRPRRTAQNVAPEAGIRTCDPAINSRLLYR